ncbi:hypothetical protein J6590_073312 [Homalodisca vitripennis]|nr:hypothetical protein J6590_073312 [Homalodisca vitripennis]
MDNVRCVRSELLSQERRLGYRLVPHNSSLGSGLTNHLLELINMTADTWVTFAPQLWTNQPPVRAHKYDSRYVGDH